MRLLRHPLLQRVLGTALGALFVYASLDKIVHPADFARIVYHYQVIGPSQVLPPLVPNLFAVSLPWVEVVTGLLLVAGAWRREAAAAAALMLVVFLGAVGSTLYRGIDVGGCGCFSVTAEGRRAGGLLLAQDAAMLAGALMLALARPRATGSESAAEAVPAAER